MQVVLHISGGIIKSNVKNDGFILVNKEQEMTSFDVVRQVGRIMGTKKTGHTGTLDPNAEGLVVVGVNRGTKFIQFVTKDSKKTYRATAKFGEKYDTGDIWGTLVESKDYDIVEEKLKEVMNSFLGKQMQTPPMYSAKKINGVRAYDLARQNIVVELKPCEVEIFDINLISFDGDGFVFDVTVSKGTFIRTLIEDMCEKLNTVGTMTKLVRSYSDNFNLKDAKKLADLTPEDFYPLETIAKNMYECIECGELYKKVVNGAKIEGDFIDEFIFTNDGDPIAIYKKVDAFYRLQFMF